MLPGASKGLSDASQMPLRCLPSLPIALRREEREERREKREDRREMTEERREKREEKREEGRGKREERREKREEVPKEAARGPQMRPQEVPKEVPRGLLASWRPVRVRGRDGEERVWSLEGGHEEERVAPG